MAGKKITIEEKEAAIGVEQLEVDGSLRKQFDKTIRQSKRHSQWKTVVTSLCAAVAVSTAYVLINPATTQQAETYCGFEEHIEHTDECYGKTLICELSEEGHAHGDECYKEEEVLKCELPEGEGHTHTEDCYETEEYLSCELPEGEGHTHTDECYEIELVPVEAHVHGEECYENGHTLICTLEEQEAHTHGEGCYEKERVLICGNTDEGHTHGGDCYEKQRVLICGNTDEGHTHGEGCYEKQSFLVCGNTEENHVHDESCYEERDVLVCALPESEGHVHTDECYEEQDVLVCALPEGHVHTDKCYEEQDVLVCALPESEGHVHGAECYVDEQKLICTLPETEPGADEFEEKKILICALEEYEPHQHDESCYSERQNLICTEEEAPAHTHDENCFALEKVCICEIEEQEPHEHTEECYEVDHNDLICEIPLHEHVLQCFSNPEADLETEEEWMKSFAKVTITGYWRDDILAIAKSQIGYKESSSNYEVDADGVTTRGYTRYGAWYGGAYSDWCAMFCSFCLHYAGVDEELMPIDATCATWVDKLMEKDLYRDPEDCLPAAGDLIFFEFTGDGRADHVGFVKKVIFDENGELAALETIEGNVDNTVKSASYEWGDPIIMGFSKIPPMPYEIIESKPASDGAIAIISGHIPAGAEATIEAVKFTEEDLIALVGEERAAQMKAFVAYDIKIMLDGIEWQPEPDNTVRVVVKQPEIEIGEHEKVTVTHVDDAGDATKVNAALTAEGEITFEAESFSIYLFTVEFTVHDATYSIEGTSSILLSQLLTELGEHHRIADVTDVFFSDNSLIGIEVLEGDWRLISLKAFDTEETLTITFSDETTLLVSVTDAAGTDPLSYLRTSAKNSWQLVGEKYTARTLNDKLAYDSNDTGTDPDVYLQKNVVPTDKENEFYVYLSLAKPASMEDWLRNSSFATLENKNPNFAFQSGEPGKGPMYKPEDIPSGTSGLHLKHITVNLYDKLTYDNKGNVSTYGTKLATFPVERYTAVSECSNGSIYVLIPEKNGFIKVTRGVNFHADEGGQGKPFIINISMADISGTLGMDMNSTIFDSVTDVLGDNIELVSENGSPIIYCDGTCTPSADGRSLVWNPIAENPDTEKVYPTTNPLKCILNNNAQLIYKVRLRTDTDDFLSCADPSTGDKLSPLPTATQVRNVNFNPSAYNAYPTNDHATLVYHTQPMTGGSGSASPSRSTNFPIPYVRGLHYDISLIKTDADGNKLEGAVFTLLDSTQNPIMVNGAALTATSDANGKAAFMDLSSELFTQVSYVTESQAPAGYDMPDTHTWSLPINYTEKTSSSDFAPDSNPYSMDMRVTKYDSGSSLWTVVNTKKPGKLFRGFNYYKDTGTNTEVPLFGGTFEIYAADASGNKNATPIADYSNLVGNMVGVFTPDGDIMLPYGTYYISQTSAHSGYYPYPSDIKIEVTDSGITLISPTGDSNLYLSTSGDVTILHVPNTAADPTVPIGPKPPQYPPDDPAVTYSKTIDYLGDNRDSNGNLLEGMNDLYRLHMDFEAEAMPVDLLIVLDQSTYMDNVVSGGKTGQTIIREVLNGTKSDHTDGFIYEFLNSCPDNKLAIVTFDNDSSASTTATSYAPSRYIYQWAGGSTAAKYVNLPQTINKSSARVNYTAAYWAADQIWGQLNETNPNAKKVMVFLAGSDPTFAYKDGGLHHGFDASTNDPTNSASNVAGTGTVGNCDSLDDMVSYVGSGGTSYSIVYNTFIGAFFKYIEDGARKDAGSSYIGSTTNSTNRRSMIEYQSNFRDDSGKYALMHTQVMDQGCPAIYPQVIDIAEMKVSIPGISDYPYGTINRNAFNTFYTGDWATITSPSNSHIGRDIGEFLFGPNGNDGAITYLPVYDLYYLTENAYMEFNLKHKDVSTYSIMMNADSADATVKGGARYKDEVMRFMSGDNVFHANAAAALDAAVSGVPLLQNVKLTDQLSDYAQLAENPNIEITVQLSDDTSPVAVYKNGAWVSFSSSNRHYGIFNTSKSPYDPATKTVSVQFADGKYFNEDLNIHVSFDVTPTAKARLEWEKNGESYGDPAPRGDLNTDYVNPDPTAAVNNTSSNHAGFYSNVAANSKVSFTRLGNHEENFLKPVLQVFGHDQPVEPPPVTYPEYDDQVTIAKQIDYLGDNEDASGELVEGTEDLYRLYLTLEAEQQSVDLLLVIDQSSSMSDTDTSITGYSSTKLSDLQKILNGTETDHSDGFIHQFLSSNTDNRLAVLSFGSDSNAGDGTVSRYIRSWDATSETISLGTASGGRNYASALAAADEIWSAPNWEDVGNKQIMIFISDGAPTLAYSDGQMHNLYTNSKLLVGNPYDPTRIGANDPATATRIVNTMFGDTSSSALSTLLSGASVTNDKGASVSLPRYIYLYPQNYPVVYDASKMFFELPGTNSYPGYFVTDSGLYNAAKSTWNGLVSSLGNTAFKELYDQFIADVVPYMGQANDLMYLSEWAFSEFAAEHTDVITYSVGYGSGTKYALDDGRSTKEVLEYMSGEDRFFQCDDLSELRDFLKGIVFLKDVSMTDKLSAYAQMAETPDFRILLITEDEPDGLELADGTGLTAAGKTIIDEDTYICNLETGEFYFNFLEDAYYNEDLELRMEFTITNTPEAVDDLVTYGYEVKGDEDTDYEDNTTSSGKFGFWSNDNVDAFAEWTRVSEAKEAFPRPVLQARRIPEEIEEPDPITPPDSPDDVSISKTIDYLGDNNNATDDDKDLYKLYLDLKAADRPIDLLLVVDQSTSMEEDLEGDRPKLDDNSTNPLFSGKSRQSLLIELLNGEDNDGTGYIKEFREANPLNRLAVLTFGHDSSLGDSRYLIKWENTSTTDGNKVNLPANPATQQATNYAAALYNANAVWKKLDTIDTNNPLPTDEPEHERIMIFLSDGEPTLAYKDGKMHTTLKETEGPVGRGSSGVYDSNSHAYMDFAMILSSTNTDAMYSKAFSNPNDTTYRQQIMNLQSFRVVDDVGTAYAGAPWEFDTTEKGFPREFSLLEATLDLPGVVGYPYGSFSDPDAYMSAYAEYTDDTPENRMAWVFGGKINGTRVPGVLKFKQPYDIFYLTESAFADFADKNEDVVTYTIGFGTATAKSYNNGRYADEVLKYMVGQEATGSTSSSGSSSGSSRFFQCNDATTLEKVIGSITELRSVTLSDTLSQYVKLYSPADLKVTLNNPNYCTNNVPEVLYDASNTSDPFTTLGKELLDQTKTKITTTVDSTDPTNPITTETIDVVFKDTVGLSRETDVEASFTVKLTDFARSEWERLNHSYGTTKGDLKTDYVNPDTSAAENKTSSNQPGFFSNVAYDDEDEPVSLATWKRGDPDQGVFPKPVVQATKEPHVPVAPPDPVLPTEPPQPVSVKKQIDYLGDEVDSNGKPVQGQDDLYRLYLNYVFDPEPTDLMLVLDQSGSMNYNLAGQNTGDTGVTDTVSRQTHLTNFLNGANGNDGFIAQFLSSSNNDLCVIKFSSADKTSVLLDWGTEATSVSLTTPPIGATDYTAALALADAKWEAKDSATTHRKIMIFLSDGVPSVAYADGKMIPAADSTTHTIVGTGNDGSTGTFDMVDFVTRYLDIISTDADFADGDPTYKDERLAAIADGRVMYAFTSGDNKDPDYPIVYDFTKVRFKIPGVNGDFLGDFTENTCSTFLAFYDSWTKGAANGGMTDTQKTQWIADNLVAIDDYYDVFWLTESACNDFQLSNAKVLTYGIGFSSDMTRTYAKDESGNARAAAEVLTYLCGADRYFPCSTGDGLKAIVENITALSRLVIADPLSEYMVLDTNPNLTIDLKYKSSTLPLYKEKAFVTYTPAYLDTANSGLSTDGDLTVKFNPDLRFYEKLECDASFNVRITKDAYDEWVKNGKNYDGVTGDGSTTDPVTDHDPNHITSSGKPGFYSNDNDDAKASWVYGGGKPTGSGTTTPGETDPLVREKNFPKPVAQVPAPMTIGLKKVDATNDVVMLAGAEFDLYEPCDTNTVGKIELTDADGNKHYVVKHNTNPYVSTNTGAVLLENLDYGHYYLVETKAPMGYTRLEHPVEFDLNMNGIPTKSDDDTPLSYDDQSGIYVLKVVNSSGYELPETGGRGTSFFTLGGLALMSISVMMYGFSMRRRKERREKA